ncbi:MAG: dephospho-CoA kinase [Nanoarchaeota archaeon]|nr:dephospho-CoA kinase [Nanoarchaeota archaeon]
MIIGVTGTFGSGKSLVAGSIGFNVIDVDRIGHKVLEIKKDELAQAFGKEILVKGKVSRRRLGRIVFSNSIKLKKLNSIVHPQLILEVKQKAKDNCVIDAALLCQLGLDKLCDKTILVKANKKIQIERLLNKGYSKTQIENVIAEQETALGKLKADLIVHNNKTKEEVCVQVKRWLKKQQ